MDKGLLEYEMSKKDITADELCGRLKISRSAFYRKLRGVSEFTHSEMETIASIFGIDKMNQIFFADEVS